MKTYLEVVDSTNFNEIVLKEHLPVVVHFRTPWCKKCKDHTPCVEHLAKKFRSQAKFVCIDADEDLDIAHQYGIRSLPGIVIFKNGIPLFKSIGIKSRNALEHDIETMLSK